MALAAQEKRKEFTHVKHVFRVTLDPELAAASVAAAQDRENYDMAWWIGWHIASACVDERTVEISAL